MPERDYKTRWLRVPDHFVPLIDEVIRSDAAGHLNKAAGREVVEELGLCEPVVQVWRDGQELRAAIVFPEVFEHKPAGGGDHIYALLVNEGHDGVIPAPENLEALDEESRRSLEQQVGSPYGPAATIGQIPMPTKLPVGFDPNVHVFTRRQIYTTADLGSEGPTVHDEMAYRQ
jgi:hypothetical protein